MNDIELPVFYPESMKSLNNWVLWKLETGNNGRITKVPYSPKYNGHASSSNPKTWGTYEEAYREYMTGKYNGLGFVFSLDTGIVFIDVDHCIDDKGYFNSIATDVISTMGKDTYIELSQSGTGLHIFSFATIPDAIKRAEIEMYSSGRFVAMTGKALSPLELSDKHIEVSKIYEKYKKVKKAPQRPIVPTENKLSLSDNEIINRASRSKNTGELFRKLMSGDFSEYGSQSEADFKLCSILSFWSDRDYETIERIFTSSGLCRDKWLERADYRKRTIKTAINSTIYSISEYIALKENHNV